VSIESMVRVLGARRSGSGWMARCPTHEDRSPSLSIQVVNGKLLVHCFAGCTQRDVIDALKARGLSYHLDTTYIFRPSSSPRMLIEARVCPIVCQRRAKTLGYESIHHRWKLLRIMVRSVL
jgi:hypothetical protein